MPVLETRTTTQGWQEARGTSSGPPDRGVPTDEQLARAAGRGDAAAFEALYERHHRPLLSFARHMVGRLHDAEDVVQHTFLAADLSFRAGTVPKAVRAWLYTVARNRSVSLLRSRREYLVLDDGEVPSMDGLAATVEQREDVRALLADLRRLPDDQRAALLLAELGDLTHAEVGAVIGVRQGKVKALVFQAREALVAAADARLVPCPSIRDELTVASGAALRRRELRNHLEQCAACADFAARVRARRAALAAVLPVVPGLALRESVLAGMSSGAMAAGTGAGALSAGSVAAKLLTIAAVGGAAAGGGALGITDLHAPAHERPAASVRTQPAAPRLSRAVRITAPAEPAGIRHPLAGKRPRAATPAARGRADEPRHEQPSPRGRAPRAAPPPAPSGQAVPPPAHPTTPPGHAHEQQRTIPPGQAKKPPGAVPPGQSAVPPGQAKKQPATRPEPASQPTPSG